MTRMSRTVPPPMPKEQILIALDARGDHLESLRLAIAWATQTQAELLGLFVEDEDLLQVAELPYAWEVRLWSAQERQLDGQAMARSLRALASRVRGDLAREAKQAQLRWSFQTRRGHPLEVVLAARGEAAALVVGGRRRGRPLGKAGQPEAVPSGLGLVLTDSPAAQRALEVALAIARGAGLDLESLTLGEGAGGNRLKRLEQVGMAGLRDGGRLGRLADLPTRVFRRQWAAVVMPADLVLDQDPEQRLKLLTGLSCPLVLVR